jgi:hypothetical protein
LLIVPSDLVGALQRSQNPPQKRLRAVIQHKYTRFLLVLAASLPNRLGFGVILWRVTKGRET